MLLKADNTDKPTALHACRQMNKLLHPYHIMKIIVRAAGGLDKGVDHRRKVEINVGRIQILLLGEGALSEARKEGLSLLC